MGKLYITPRAKSNLNDIWSLIAADNIAAADGVYHRIMRKAQLAADNPYMGASRSELSSNARILIEGRYIIIYEPKPDGVSIITVVHAMRNMDNILDLF